MHNLNYQPIGTLRSCFKEKFGIPRQPGLATHATAELELLPEYGRPEAIRGLEGFSHLWILFHFHGVPEGEWRPTVRPPRLGGNQRIGVFASRSNFRPNPIGLSAVELVKIEAWGNSHRLHLRGGDFLDGTPVLDIKPYLPYSDAISSAEGSFANEPPGNTHQIKFSDVAEAQLAQQLASYPQLRQLIIELLCQDPRPAYHRDSDPDRQYACHLYEFDLRWQVAGTQVVVLNVVKTQAVDSPPPQIR